MKRVYIGSVGIPASAQKTTSTSSINGHGEGISVFVWDGTHYTLEQIMPCLNAGIITMSHNGKYLYAVNESKDFTGLNGSGGGVSAFRINGDGSLSKLNESISYGSRPSNLDVSEDGKYLYVSNHGSHTTVTCHYEQDPDGEWKLHRGFDDASAAMFQLEEDGSIGRLLDLKVFDGCGYWCHGGGQSTSHLHTIRTSKDIVTACNRGADSIEVMKLDKVNQKLTLLKRNQVRPGLAPRHMIFHPCLDLIYVANENYPCISVYTLNRRTGALDEIETLPTMADSYYNERPLPSFQKRHALAEEKNTCGFADKGAAMPSDIHISADGRFLYVSNRRFSTNGSIAVFKINAEGTLQSQGVDELECKDPRGFQTLADDQLIVGMMDIDKACIFTVNQETGRLMKCVEQIQVASPASFVQGDQ